MFRRPYVKRRNVELSDVYQKVLSVKRIVIDEDFCKGCGLCAEACPKKLLRIGNKLTKQGYPLVEISEADQENCISCALCARICPDVAITVVKDGKS